MGQIVIFLIFTGLYLNWAARAQMDPLPRPTLWAVPSPVVHRGANVTLRCQGHLGSDRFQLWQDGDLKEERNASWQQTEFVLRNVEDLRNGGSYSCRSRQGPLWSEFSEVLALVVTGVLPKPSISASPDSTISPGQTVIIRCQISQQGPPQDYIFALLEAKNLEPLQLQRSAGTWAAFFLKSVKAEDTGSYSCIYYRKTVPHKGSYPSNTLELTVLGLFPKPTLWVQPGLVVVPGISITFHCLRPKLSSLEEVTFTLGKAGAQEPLQQQNSTNLWTSFLLTSVRPKDTGSYSCAYRKSTASTKASKPSEALELMVSGSLPKPSLSAFPGLVVEPGMHVTLKCRQPPQTSLWSVTFTLLKLETPKALQSQSPAGTSAEFSLLYVRAQDAGNYSCVYHWKMTPYQVSEPSEVLEIWVTDALPKSSLSAWPQMVSGAKVTLLCRGPSWSSTFVLYKDRDEKNLPTMDNTQDGAKFILSEVTPEDSGNYSCSYQMNTNGRLWTQHSDPLQLIVIGSETNNILIITLSCVSLLLLLLCLLLLAVLWGLFKKTVQRGVFVVFVFIGVRVYPINLNPPEWRSRIQMQSRGDQEIHRSPCVKTGSNLCSAENKKIRILNKKKPKPTEKATEPTLHVPVLGD